MKEGRCRYGTVGVAAKQRTARGRASRRSRAPRLTFIIVSSSITLFSPCIASYLRKPNLHQLRNTSHFLKDTHPRMTRPGKRGHAHAGLSIHACARLLLFMRISSCGHELCRRLMLLPSLVSHAAIVWCAVMCMRMSHVVSSTTTGDLAQPFLVTTKVKPTSRWPYIDSEILYCKVPRIPVEFALPCLRGTPVLHLVR